MQTEFSASLNQSSELDDPLEICLGLEICCSRNISYYLLMLKTIVLIFLWEL